jgi:hypothetical protein
MAKGEVFWIIYLLCVLFGFGWNIWNTNTAYTWVGSWVPNMILFGLLGWAVFGPIIH